MVFQKSLVLTYILSYDLEKILRLKLNREVGFNSKSSSTNSETLDSKVVHGTH